MWNEVHSGNIASQSSPPKVQPTVDDRVSITCPECDILQVPELLHHDLVRPQGKSCSGECNVTNATTNAKELLQVLGACCCFAEVVKCISTTENENIDGEVKSDRASAEDISEGEVVAALGAGAGFLRDLNLESA